MYCFVQSLNHIYSAIPWTIACQVSLFFLSPQLISVPFSRSVMSDSVQPHESQHARPPCPSPTPGVYPNPCPLSWWCHPTISSSVIPLSLSMGFPRQEYRSGLPCPLPGDLSHPGIESVTRPTSPALADRFFTTRATWAALGQEYQNIKLNKSLLIWGHALGIQDLLSRKHPRDGSNMLLECS